MVSTAFTEFRKKAASYLDKAEHGETIIITRHGKAVAELIPAVQDSLRAWKKPAPRLSIKGVSISREIISGRENAKA